MAFLVTSDKLRYGMSNNVSAEGGIFRWEFAYGSDAMCQMLLGLVWQKVDVNVIESMESLRHGNCCNIFGNDVIDKSFTIYLEI